MTNTEIREFIENAIADNPVMLFMKGSPEQPACGFSARTAACLNALGVRYAALDILPDQRIREELSGLSGWPTIPQLFVKGELVGGADIVTEMYESGELADLLEAEQPEDAEDVAAQSEAPVGNGPLPLENRLD
jgi:monothiol glutaredoxin